MGALPNATGFTAADFDRLARTTSEASAIESQAAKIDALLHRLNQTMFASRFSAARMWLEKPGDLFLTKGNYVHGGDNQHWYVFHRGGRWEPEFNIGMYGRPQNGERYLRIGLGFNLTLASADPDRENGLKKARTLFRSLQAGAQTPDGRVEVVAALQTGRAKAEHVSQDGPAVPSAPEDIADWLARRVNADDTRWVFVGQALSPDIPDEAEVLADMGSLAAEVSRTFAAWLPVWERALRSA
jgi:hypothetical protein